MIRTHTHTHRRDVFEPRAFLDSLWQVVQLSSVLDALLDSDSDVAPDELESFFLEALYCSLGASLLQSGRKKFDDFVKKISGLTAVHEEKILAGPGELPGTLVVHSFIHWVWLTKFVSGSFTP